MELFETTKEDISEALHGNVIDVVSFIERLQALSAVNEKYIPMFDADLFEGVSTIDTLWEKFKVFWLFIFDCHALEIFLQQSECKKALKLYENFSSKINKPSIIDHVDLLSVCKLCEQQDFQMSFLQIKIDETYFVNSTKEKVYEALSEAFNVQKSALHLTEIKKGSFQLKFRIPEMLVSYFLDYKVTGHTLIRLADQNIVTIQVNDKEIKVPKVINQVLCLTS